MKRQRLASRGLSYDERLHGETAFKWVFKARRSKRDGPFALHYCMQDAPSRLGIVVSRAHGTAVARNRAKRVIREQFRHCKRDLRPGDYIVRICKPLADYSVDELKRALTFLFEASR